MASNMFVIEQATRELIFAKLALIAPSGGGKTYSALRLATGMLEELKARGLQKNGKILLANTEQKRGLYYADEFIYDIIHVNAPHNPEKYVDLIDYVVSKDYPIMILDSTTHEWEGTGGCLELHQAAGGTFQSWGKVTPRHKKFLIALADSPIHIIATMRADDQYVIEKDANEKQNVKKLGVGAQQRKGFEYEFTATFSIDQDTNVATPKKDNTHLFEHDNRLLSEKDGKAIIEWANSGKGFTPTVRDVSEMGETQAEPEKGVSDVKALYKSIRKEHPELSEKFDELLSAHGVTSPAKLDTSAQQQLVAEMQKLVETK